MGANDRQVGGAHYGPGSALQHWDIVERYNVGYLEGCASKYLSRYHKKNGSQDLDKALHYIDKMLEMREDRSHPRLARGWVPLDVLETWFTEQGVMSDAQPMISTILSMWDIGTLTVARRRVAELLAQERITEREVEEAKQR